MWICNIVLCKSPNSLLWHPLGMLGYSKDVTKYLRFFIFLKTLSFPKFGPCIYPKHLVWQEIIRTVKAVSFNAVTAGVSRLHGDVMMTMTARTTATRRIAVSNLNLFLTGVLCSYAGFLFRPKKFCSSRSLAKFRNTRKNLTCCFFGKAPTVTSCGFRYLHTGCFIHFTSHLCILWSMTYCTVHKFRLQFVLVHGIRNGQCTYCFSFVKLPVNHTLL